MIYAVEGLYKKEILKEFKIVDFVINGDTGLIKWEKMAKPLTDKEIKLMYETNRKKKLWFNPTPA